MSPAIKKQITKCFGFAPVLINSALVSAQNRERFYWVGKRNASGGYSPVMIEQPQDRGIVVKDILDNADSLPIRQTGIATLCINSKVDGKQPSVQHRIYDANYKMPAVTASFNPRAIYKVGDYKIRKLSISECKRLQTVPEWYDMTGIAQSQAYKCLGNGWTVEVIAHLIRATTGTEKKGQTSLDSF